MSRFVEYYNKNKDKVLARQRIRASWVSMLKIERGCIDCGYDKHPEALQFDHRGLKAFQISEGLNRSDSAILDEIEKCDVVCANCHAIRTYARLAQR